VLYSFLKYWSEIKDKFNNTNADGIYVNKTLTLKYPEEPDLAMHSSLFWIYSFKYFYNLMASTGKYHLQELSMIFKKHETLRFKGWLFFNKTGLLLFY
jgi:hypothetical protein